MFLPVCTVYVCMSFCVFCVFFSMGPLVPELKCTYLLTYFCSCRPGRITAILLIRIIKGGGGRGGERGGGRGVRGRS